MSALSRPIKPRLDHLCTFGAMAYVHLPPKTHPRGQKFATRAQIGHLVDYSEGNNFRIWLPFPNKVIRSAYVLFNEDKKYDPSPLLKGNELDIADVGVEVNLPSTETSLDAPPPATFPRPFPIIAPPLGFHPPEDLAADALAAPEVELPPPVPINRRSVRMTKGVPATKLEDEIVYDLTHKQL